MKVVLSQVLLPVHNIKCRSYKKREFWGRGRRGGGVEIPVQMIFYHTSKPIVEWWRNEAVCRIQIGENGPGVLPRR